MNNKKTFKSIGLGVLDFLLAIPLLFLLSYLYLFLIDIFHITDVAAIIIFSIGIGSIFVKYILDVVLRRDKELKIFWTSFICAYILLILLEIFLILFKFKNIPFWKTLSLTFLFTLILLFYVFLMIRTIKIKREKYESKMKFWGYWVILPILISLIFVFIVPNIVIFMNKGLNARTNEHLGISSLKELYKPDINENGIHLLDAEILKNRLKINENKFLGGWYKSIPEDVFNNEVKEYADAYVPLLDSLSRYRFIQKGWIGDYEDNPFTIPLPNYTKVITLAKAGLVSAMYDIKNGDLSSASDKIEKVWHIAKIVRDNSLLSDMVSIIIGKYLLNLIYRGIKDGWALRKEFSNITKEIPIEIEKMPLVIPCSIEFIKGKPARLPGMQIVMFSNKEFIRTLTLKIAGRLSYPIIISNYPTTLKFFRILLPHKFTSKDEYIKYYRENDIESKTNEFVNKAEKRIISSAYLFLPNYTTVINKEREYIALARVLKTALEIEAVKKQTGKYPEHLEKIPDDPFTGKPLIYKHLKNGYVIYSVGDDGIDNGGYVESKEAKDIGFKKI